MIEQKLEQKLVEQQLQQQQVRNLPKKLINKIVLIMLLVTLIFALPYHIQFNLNQISIKQSLILLQVHTQKYLYLALRYTIIQIVVNLKQLQNKHKNPIKKFRSNFASINGGATILMQNSSSRGMSNILSSDNDKYMTMQCKLPIVFVIALKQQVLIQDIQINSLQMYSCITQDFRIDGSQNYPKNVWTELGTYSAKNIFTNQLFTVINKKVIRYLKITILSVYGNWKYFTLTEFRVFGEGIFAHAKDNINQNIDQNDDDQECKSDLQFDDFQQDKNDEDNLIINLHNKIKKLENQNEKIQEILKNHTEKQQEQQKKKQQEERNQILQKDLQQINKQIQSLNAFNKVISIPFAIFVILLLLIVLSLYIKSCFEIKADNQLSKKKIEQLE